MNEDNKNTETEKVKKTKKTIIIAAAGCVLLLAVCALLIVYFSGGFGEDEENPFPPLPPESFEDTKPEDFDIMEYDEYLGLNRYVKYQKDNVTVIIDDESYTRQGEAVELVYEMIQYLIAGDVKNYNALLGDDSDKKEWFSQQQIYDISIIDGGRVEKEGRYGKYTEYVVTLKYKIHENNGSYRNNLHSDASRPQYIVINDSTGELLIMDIIDTFN